MKKITINKIDEDIYYEKLDNGLEVYLYTYAFYEMQVTCILIYV